MTKRKSESRSHAAKEGPSVPGPEPATVGKHPLDVAAEGSFESLGVRPPFLGTLRKLGFDRATPVQERAIPPILDGRDLVGSAETGSGKTAAFLLPVMGRLVDGKRHGGTRVLVLVPTRELAMQVKTVAKDLAPGTGLRCEAVYGGVGMRDQTHALQRGVDIIVATPGRLLDHAQRGSTRFKGLETLILDEADRMLDMGFLPDIRRILALVPKERQTLLFSATMPPSIAALSREVLRNPERVRVGDARRATVPVGITHVAYPVNTKRKSALLTALFRREHMSSVVVFCRTKHRADRLARTLDREGFPSGVLHGNRSQGQREKALAAFRAGHVKVLVATDLAARGLDIEGVSHVVNFDFPRTPEDYIHRVGRTARADAKGDAIALVSPEETSTLTAVEREMGMRVPRLKLDGFDYGSHEAPPAPQAATPATARKTTRHRAGMPSLGPKVTNKPRPTTGPGRRKKSHRRPRR